MSKISINFVALFICVNLLIVILFFFYFIRDNGTNNVTQANERVVSMTEESMNQVYSLDPNVKEKIKQEILEELKSYVKQIIEQGKTEPPSDSGNGGKAPSAQ